MQSIDSVELSMETHTVQMKQLEIVQAVVFYTKLSFPLTLVVSMSLLYFNHNVSPPKFDAAQECLSVLHSSNMHTNKVCQSEIN